MERKYIAIQRIISDFNIDRDIIQDFSEFGLISVYNENDEECIDCDEVDDVLSMVRMKKDLGINNEGIDIIINMRQQLSELNKELNYLRNRLKTFEDEYQIHLVEIPHKQGLIREIDPEED